MSKEISKPKKIAAWVIAGLLTGLFLSRQDINGQKHQKYVYECSKNKITGNEIKRNTLKIKFVDDK